MKRWYIGLILTIRKSKPLHSLLFIQTSTFPLYYRTVLEQSAVVSIRGVPLINYMEDLMASTISSNANKVRLQASRTYHPF